MKTIRLAVFFFIVVQFSYGGELPDSTRPTLSVLEAISVSQEFAIKTRKDTKRYYISSVAIHREHTGHIEWKIRYDLVYDPREIIVKGDWFIIHVDMDRTCGISFGK